MGTMAIPDQTGHTAATWRADDPASVAEAESLFRSLTARRLVPFARRAPAEGTPFGAPEFEQIRSFEPDTDEIVWVRPLQGG